MGKTGSISMYEARHFGRNKRQHGTLSSCTDQLHDFSTDLVSLYQYELSTSPGLFFFSGHISISFRRNHESDLPVVVYGPRHTTSPHLTTTAGLRLQHDVCRTKAT